MTTCPHLVVAVTFAPTPSQLDRLAAQLGGMGVPTAIWDNSLDPPVRESVRLQCETAGIRLLGDGENAGTGVALNAFTRLAAELGADWLTYFDQDSLVTNEFRHRLAVLPSLPSEVGAVGSPYDDAASGRLAVQHIESWPEAQFLIASGTSWRVSALHAVDGADEAMFLDLVDHELCLRLRQFGYRLVLDSKRQMKHAIGEAGHAFGARLSITRHPRWRRVMMWRNSIRLVRRYWRLDPRACSRHLAARCAETAAGAIHYRDPSLITSALQGTLAGFHHSKRQGLGQLPK